MKYSKWITTTLLIIGVLSLGTTTAVAQTLTVIHSFSGGGDGANPSTGISIDSADNLYGTAGALVVGDNGSVWQLRRAGTGWILNPLHNFTGTPDGSSPTSRPIFGPDGSLYGVTEVGGNQGCTAIGPGCGLVYRLTPTATACKTSICPWVETVLYRFAGQPDGGNPQGDWMLRKGWTYAELARHAGKPGSFRGEQVGPRALVWAARLPESGEFAVENHGRSG